MFRIKYLGFVLFLFIVLKIHPSYCASNNNDGVLNFLHSWLASQSVSSEIKSIKEVQSSKDGTLYLATLKNKGFVVVQKVVSSIEVIGFSFDHSFELSDDNPFNNQIITVNPTGKALKKVLAQDDVEPLTDALFGQDKGWNALCPNDPGSPDGKAPVGCVGTAMAIIMRYWKFPFHAQGSSSYKHKKYGDLTVDFSKASYNWDKMSSTSPDSYNTQLLYHCAIAVKTRFDSTASSSYDLEKATYAFKQFFSYSKSLYSMRKSQTTSELWKAAIKAEIKSGRPVLYTGYTSNSAHDFIVDGCKGEYFHINWGWGGKFNGYFLLDNIIVSDRNYSNSHRAIFGIEPQPVSKPESFTVISKTDRIDLSWQRPPEKSILTYFPLPYDSVDTKNNSITPQRVSCFNPADFSFESPVTIYAIGQAFHIPASNASDTIFNYTIYGSDGKSVSYKSDTLSAQHDIESIHTLSAPVQMSDTFYVGVTPLNTSSGYPATNVTCVPVSQCRSFWGSAGNWDPLSYSNPAGLEGRELHTYVYIMGKRSVNSIQKGGYLIWRDGKCIDTIRSLATTTYSDIAIHSGAHCYKVATFIDTAAYCSAFTDSITVSPGANVLPLKMQMATQYTIRCVKQGIELFVTNDEDVGLAVYSLDGKIVRQFPSARYSAGSHFIRFNDMNNGNNFLSNSISLLKIQIGKHEMYRKIVIH